MHVLGRCSSPTSSRSPIGRLLTTALNACDKNAQQPKNLSYYVHPEKIRQKIKEKDAYKLCKFFDSPEYKNKVAAFLEMQHNLLTKGAPLGVQEGDVKYEHVLSCAQPKHKKVKTVIEKPASSELKKQPKIKMVAVAKVKKRTTAFEELLKKKNMLETNGGSIAESERALEMKEEPKSTILPVLLSAQENKQKRKYRQKATIMPIYLKKMKKNKEQQEILARLREKYDKNDRQYNIAQDEELDENSVDTVTEDVAFVNTSVAPRPSTPNTNLRTMGTYTKRKSRARNIKQELGETTEENMPNVNVNKIFQNTYERTAIIEAIKNKHRKHAPARIGQDSVMSLFQRVKSDSQRRKIKEANEVLEQHFSKSSRVGKPSSAVSNTRLRREANLKEKAKRNPGFWLDSVKQTKKQEYGLNEANENDYEMRLVSKNYVRNYHKSIVDTSDNSSGAQLTIKGSRYLFRGNTD